MSVNRFYLMTLIALVILLGYLNYHIMKPFLVPIAWAIVLSVLFYPVYAFVLKYIKYRSVASLLILCVILLIIIGPVYYLSFMLVKELGVLTDYLRSFKLDDFKGLLEHPITERAIEKVTSFFHLAEGELEKAIADTVLHLRQEWTGRITRGVRDVINVTISFFIMAFAIFFLLRDGPKFFMKVRDYMPFSEAQKDKLVKRAEDVIISTIYGGVVVAMAQGSLGGLAFFIFGISSPVLWGFCMAIASFLPLVGPFIIWAPAALLFFIEGEIWRGIGLTIAGALGISLADNFLRPIIIGNRTKMPVLIIFFSVLGGIKLFGFIGFILGPLALATFFSVIEIFRSMEEPSP